MPNSTKTEQKPPRDILYSIWGDKIGILPINGGWGHTIENAVVINKNDPSIVDSQHFNGFEIENTFIKYRTYVEFIHNRVGKSNELAGIEFINKVQELITGKNSKIYDKVEVEIRALHFSDYELLKQEWDNNFNNNNFNKEEHMKKRDSQFIYEKRDFWFEISSFYGTPVI